MQILGLPGSLRERSYNAALLRAAVELAPKSCRIEIGSLRGIPLYDGDLEARDGIPPAVTALKDRLAASDALLLATPEYNNSVPGVLKNAIDWMTRPAADVPRIFHGRIVGVVGATPGGQGTMLAQSAWLPVWRTLGCRPWFGGRLYLSNAAQAFDAAGSLSDASVRKRLADYLEAFAAFVAQERSRQ